MNNIVAEVIAKDMSYQQCFSNLCHGTNIPYKKATLKKAKTLFDNYLDSEIERLSLKEKVNHLEEELRKLRND